MDRRMGLGLLALSALLACDANDPTAVEEDLAADQAVLALLEHANYRGPVVVQDWSGHDLTGVREGRALALPRAGLEALARARAAEPSFAPRLQAALGVQQAAAEITDPEEIDAGHNTRTADLGGYIRPSVSNGPSPVRSELRFTNRFYAYDYANDRWYIIQAGTVDSSRVVARDSASGHYHGAVAAERSLGRRVGWLEPDRGSFSGGTWSDTWKAPEYAQEVSFQYVVTEIGGPNDGETDTFYSLEPWATRLPGLARMPPPTDASYVRVGGTNVHPEDFNDWGVPALFTGIRNTASDYYANTNRADHVRVNDIGLFYGGRFDLAATWGEGRASHQEHRFGTEVDFRPATMTAARRAQFVKAAEGKFGSMIYETVGDPHYHARAAGSYYNR